MASPDACVIIIKCHEWQRDKVKRQAKMQGKTIQRYALDRLMLEWTDRELEDLGFGLVLRELREKGYPDHYIKEMMGEMLCMVKEEADYYDVEWQKRMEAQRMRIKDEQYKAEIYGTGDENYG